MSDNAVVGRKSDVLRLQAVLIAAQAAVNVNAILNPEAAQARLNKLRLALDEMREAAA